MKKKEINEKLSLKIAVISKLHSHTIKGGTANSLCLCKTDRSYWGACETDG